MSRLSVAVLNLDGEDAPALTSVKAAAEAVDMSFTHVSGSLEDILVQIENWTILPEIVVLQAPEGMEAIDAIGEVGSRFPEGEAELILFNVPNDIRVYRELKLQGVREVFSGVPTEEEMAEALDLISKDNLRRTGIDPRKTVYVWSACGGAGGTSLAISFARKFAKEGRRTLFIDLDLATGPASFMFNAEKGARETSGLIDALANPSRIDALFLERAIDVADKNLFYLSARRRPSDPVPLPAALTVLIARAQQNFDMIVVDIPWRPNPEPDISTVQGHSYIVAPPTPAGLLGFSILMKDLQNAPGKSPVFGVINRVGEFKSNDIMRATFKESGDVDYFQIPYDAATAGRMFYEQRSFLELSGRIGKALERVLKTLPGEALPDTPQKGSAMGRKKPEKKKKRGLFGF